jgi:hypothetical protein
MNEENPIEVETDDQVYDATRISLRFMMKIMSELVSENKVCSKDWYFYKNLIEGNFELLEKRFKSVL